MTPAYRLDNAGIEGPEGSLVKGMNWTIRAQGVTALLGPAGTGKSLILRTLARKPLPSGWRRLGSWRRHETDLFDARQDAQDIVWAPQVQRARGSRTEAQPTTSNPWREALASGAPTVLLDEPDAGLGSDARDELETNLRRYAKGAAAVVVTHDLSFARAVARDVVLLCAGSLVAQCEADEFFNRPPNALAARFVRDGNCWPGPSDPPPLPTHFHWILPGSLAGMGRPGLLGPVREEISAIMAAGVGHLVSLTEEPLAPASLPPGLSARHFPIPDMGVPAIGPTASLCRQIEKTMTAGTAVAIHCQAGMGRTGTLLAAMLVWLGDSPSNAITRIRAISPGYIQNKAQADFVSRFSEAVSPAPR